MNALATAEPGSTCDVIQSYCLHLEQHGQGRHARLFLFYTKQMVFWFSHRSFLNVNELIKTITFLTQSNFKVQITLITRNIEKNTLYKFNVKKLKSIFEIKINVLGYDLIKI